jgi:hypothetical protein
MADNNSCNDNASNDGSCARVRKCVHANTTIAKPDCFKLKIGVNVTGSTGTLGATGAVAGTVSYALGLCNSVITFSDICCFNNMQSIVLAIPLNFTLDCFNYSLNGIVLGPQTTSTFVATTAGAGATGVLSPIDIEVNGQYLYIIIQQDHFDVACTSGACNNSCSSDADGCDSCVVTIQFTNFNLPVTRAINYCNCSSLCRPVVWYFGATPAAALLT